MPAKARGSSLGSNGRRFVVQTAVSGRPPVSRFPGPVPGVCFGFPDSPRARSFAPSTPPGLPSLCSPTSQLLLPSLTSPCRSSSVSETLLSSAIPLRPRDGMETSQVPVQCVRACLGSSTPRDSDSPCHSGESDAAFGQTKSLGIPNFLPFRCSIAPPARAPVNA